MTQLMTNQVPADCTIASENRILAWMENGPAWTFISPDSPQAELFAGAAGGQAAMVENALAEGARVNSILLFAWPGVDDNGAVQDNPDGGPAYLWQSRFAEPGEVAHIHLPMEAAVAGGCPECIRLIAKAGGNLEASTKWLFGLPLALPRVEAGMTLLTVMDPADPYQRVLGRDFLRRAIKWLERPHPKNQYYTRVLRAHRTCARVTRDYGMAYQPGPSITAAML